MHKMYIPLALYRVAVPAVVIVFHMACTTESPVSSGSSAGMQTPARFKLLSPQETGISFTNHVQESFLYNIYNYEYLYNGGGVAIGDVNGDGLPDIYFSSTFDSNKLYLNLGDLKFADITGPAGVAAASGFKTGVTMADINGDGRLDIYACRTGKQDNGLKADLVFINQGNRLIKDLNIPVFNDQANALGLNEQSNTNHASFFDYDRDGDLDLFLLNHRIDFKTATNLRLQQNVDGSVSRTVKPETPSESNRMFRNDQNRFTDVTIRAGLISAAFGLSATIADLNKDGWMDIYVANDYVEPDNMYINNGNGTFTDRYFNYLRHSSQNSMGCDIADLNNDGLEDILVLDMKAEDPVRYKTLAHVMQHDRYNLLVQYGYGRQTGRNVLQLNSGNNTFIEIGQFAGVAATDWSWSPLIADYNNDGWKDIYITNGYRKDVTNLDYMNFFMDSIKRTGGLTAQRYPDINEFLKFIPSEKLSNYLYINNGNLTFRQASEEAGMDHPSFSNGSAYADLDLDGDLDLVINNIDGTAFLYRNDLEGSHWIQIDVRLGDHNTMGIGTTADVYSANGHQCGMIMPGRGFLSSSEAIFHFGLNGIGMIDSIVLRWPDGSFEKQSKIRPNQRLTWKKGDHEPHVQTLQQGKDHVFEAKQDAISWIHQENAFNDLAREKLLPYMLSREGPCLAIGDIDGDQLDDFFAGNGSGFPAVLMKQKPDGTFSGLRIKAFEEDAFLEQCGAVFEDFDDDGDLDLMAVSGGNAFKKNAPEYAVRYYLNDGKGFFTTDSRFPEILVNAGAMLTIDLDGDADKDVIIGGRSVPGEFPRIPSSYVLLNTKGTFQEAADQLMPGLKEIGMVTSIASGDLDGDGTPEVIISGEWMPLTVFSLAGNKWVNVTSKFGLEKTSGWWKCILAEDIDADGDVDLLAGNIGLNHRMQTSVTLPITLVADDFDQNGSVDPIMCYYDYDQLFPFAGRDAMIQQLPFVKKKFQRYHTYATASLTDIFTPEQIRQATKLYTHTFQTTMYLNHAGVFSAAPLPYQVQLHPVFDMVITDFNRDGLKDILMAGNFSYAETETGELDAGNGTLLLQTTGASFTYIPNKEHGFWATGEVRKLKRIELASGQVGILTGNNNGPLQMNVLSSPQNQ